MRRTIDTATNIQRSARSTLDFNRTKIDAAEPTALFRSFLSCCRDERFNYHLSHSVMNLEPQIQLPECRIIGAVGMLV